MSHPAYLGILLHTSKYPHQACNGVLLGTVKPGGETTVERSLPLLHNWTGLSPMMEIGLDLAETHATTLKLSIVGYYQATPNFHDRGLGPVGDKVLAKLRQKSPNALGLLVHLDELTPKSHLETPGLVVCHSCYLLPTILTPDFRQFLPLRSPFRTASQLLESWN
ncbi:1475_t:CDS:2 [Acaulospora colombiana]|uniref:1475_t:CDS:1 n=1 Tax=Acaulospora colombiana TaxID=27376 RepID=A0ACA9NK97_9GLOM|nr:1475_t:CDS:2 [Acaulospora colombiana]